MPHHPVILRSVTVVVGFVAGLMLTVLVGVSPAAAHAVLLDTDPADGVVLDVPPDELTLTFNEPVQAVAEATSILTADGAPVSAEVRSIDHTVVITPSEPLADGTFIVSWRVISLDTHPVGGAFSFSVGAPSAAAPDVDTADASTALVVVRAINQAVVYTGTLLVVGLVVFELLVLHVSVGAVPVLRRRMQAVRRVALLAAGLALVLAIPLTSAWQAAGHLALLADPQSWVAGSAADTAVASLLGMIGLAVATRLMPRAAHAQRAVWPSGAALGGATLAAASLVLVGHTRTFGPAWLVLPADVLHVVAGAVWLGGLVGLVLTLGASAQVDPRRAARTVSRFSTLGAWIVVALGVTGLALGWRIVGTLEALVTTAYGLTLVVKTAVVLVVVAIAAWNRYRLVPSVNGLHAGSVAPGATAASAARGRLRRTVGVEAALLVVVLGVTGVLVSNSPVSASSSASAAGYDGASGPTTGPFETVEDLGDGTLAARLTPGRVGVNSLELELRDADGEPVEPLETPGLSVSLAEPAVGPLTRPLVETGPGRYESVLDLPLAGEWTVTVSVRTSRYENPIVQIPVEVTS